MDWSVAGTTMPQNIRFYYDEQCSSKNHTIKQSEQGTRRASASQNLWKKVDIVSMCVQEQRKQVVAPWTLSPRALEASSCASKVRPRVGETSARIDDNPQSRVSQWWYWPGNAQRRIDKLLPGFIFSSPSSNVNFFRARVRRSSSNLVTFMNLRSSLVKYIPNKLAESKGSTASQKTFPQLPRKKKHQPLLPLGCNKNINSLAFDVENAQVARPRSLNKKLMVW